MDIHSACYNIIIINIVQSNLTIQYHRMKLLLVKKNGLAHHQQLFKSIVICTYLVSITRVSLSTIQLCSFRCSTFSAIRTLVTNENFHELTFFFFFRSIRFDQSIGSNRIASKYNELMLCVNLLNIQKRQFSQQSKHFKQSLVHAPKRMKIK